MKKTRLRKFLRAAAFMTVAIFLCQQSAFALSVEKENIWFDKSNAWDGGGKQVAITLGAAVIGGGLGSGFQSAFDGTGFVAGFVEGMSTAEALSSMATGITSYGAGQGLSDIAVATEMSPTTAKYFVSFGSNVIGMGLNAGSLAASNFVGLAGGFKAAGVIVASAAAKTAIETNISNPYVANLAGFVGGLATQHVTTGALGGYTLEGQTPTGFKGMAKGLKFGFDRDWIPVTNYAVFTGVSELGRHVGLDTHLANAVGQVGSGLSNVALRARFDSSHGYYKSLAAVDDMDAERKDYASESPARVKFVSVSEIPDLETYDMAKLGENQGIYFADNGKAYLETYEQNGAPWEAYARTTQFNGATYRDYSAMAPQVGVTKAGVWGDIIKDTLIRSTVDAGIDYAVNRTFDGDSLQAVAGLGVSSLAKGIIGYGLGEGMGIDAFKNPPVNINVKLDDNKEIDLKTYDMAKLGENQGIYFADNGKAYLETYKEGKSIEDVLAFKRRDDVNIIRSSNMLPVAAIETKGAIGVVNAMVTSFDQAVNDFAGVNGNYIRVNGARFSYDANNLDSGYQGYRSAVELANKARRAASYGFFGAMEQDLTDAFKNAMTDSIVSIVMPAVDKIKPNSNDLNLATKYFRQREMIEKSFKPEIKQAINERQLELGHKLNPVEIDELITNRSLVIPPSTVSEETIYDDSAKLKSVQEPSQYEIEMAEERVDNLMPKKYDSEGLFNLSTGERKYHAPLKIAVPDILKIKIVDPLVVGVK
ncbi:MAG: hypothetical protein P9L96_02570 [Candidatus Gygaella obscura]|nr:hypothetical protein [Candidatus Gygaella obscura]